MIVAPQVFVVESVTVCNDPSMPLAQVAREENVLVPTFMLLVNTFELLFKPERKILNLGVYFELAWQISF